MPELRVIRDGKINIVSFESGAKLQTVLAESGFTVSHPCGGRGVCGKCAVKIEGAVSDPTDAEMRAGVRLSCQITLFGDASVTLPDTADSARIETEGAGIVYDLDPVEGSVGAAVDIGTTTIAVKVFDLKTGECLGTASEINPQTAVAADVMGRIEAAMKGRGDELKAQVSSAIKGLTESICSDYDASVITGNTTMLYLLTGRDPKSLSRAPFEADTLFGCGSEILERKAYLPPCMNAFVGADITCAVLSSGMCSKNETAMLCDIGTNGEIALWHDNTLYVTSTAAGPAFEGAGISCGCGSVGGAIDKVYAVNGSLEVHTIGGEKAVGVCGSGLIDAVAAALDLGLIDETGLIEDDDLPLAEGVVLQQKDIRSVQLAKAAIAAGIATLLDTAGVSAEEVKTLYIAGGFGSHLNVQSAAGIGLLPEELVSKAVVIGNAALSGAVQTLLNKNSKSELERIAACSKHVNLGGDPKFNERYMDEMLFPERE